jgi:hypothetical protein
MWSSSGAAHAILLFNSHTSHADALIDNKKMPNIAVQWALLLLHPWEAAHSNSSLETDYPDKGFPQCLHVMLGQCLKLHHSHFLPHPFQFITLIIYHLMLHSLNYWQYHFTNKK